MRILHAFCDKFVNQANSSLYQPDTSKPIANPDHYLCIRCKVHHSFPTYRPSYQVYTIHERLRSTSAFYIRIM